MSGTSVPEEIVRTQFLEALLYSEGGTLSKKKLISVLRCSPQELATAISEFRARLIDRGIELIETELELTLALIPAAGEYLKQFRLKELERDIGDAGLEVLAILLYRGPSTRSEIDYIRGVNTSSTIRTLVARGLLERITNEEDAREYRYHPTTELLAHIGVSTPHKLPDYAKIASELAAFEKSPAEGQSNEHEQSADQLHDEGTL